MDEVELIRFTPQTARYAIYYPENYELTEDEDSIVTIASTDSDSAMTISGYEVEGEADFKVLTEFLAEITEGYEMKSQPNTGDFGEGIKIEGTYTKDSNYWNWHIFNLENAIVVISINSSEELSIEQLNLYDFMLQSLEVFPN